MQLTISAWGNSLGLRIPKGIAELLGIRSGSRMRAKLKAGQLILTPLAEGDSLEKLAQGIDLLKMVSKVTSKNRHLVEEDTPEGSEVW